jgi:hypothetical protein
VAWGTPERVAESAVMVIVVVMGGTLDIAAAAAAADCACLCASPPPSAPTSSAPSLRTAISRISGSVECSTIEARSLAVMRYRLPFGSLPASRAPEASKASAVTCDWPVSYQTSPLP